uniref:TetR/AcrR family transcriptional regulator n=1 Tax=Limnohabitans sp. TaxID=1907725 RepID=UPI004048E28A
MPIEMKTPTKPSPKIKKPSRSVSATQAKTKDSAEGAIGDRRAELIEKAAHLFGERGYANTSMRDIS